VPTTWDFWQQVDREYMRLCSAMIVLRLPAWQESIGVMAEMRYAEQNNIPVILADLEFIERQSDRMCEQGKRRAKSGTPEDKR
jgi:hypothetical protein